MVEGQRQRGHLPDQISSSTTHGCFLIAPKHRIADSPGLMIGVPASTPKTPTLVIVNVPPHVGRLGLALARHRGQVAERARELEQREPLGVLDVRHHEPARRRRRDAEVDVVLETTSWAASSQNELSSGVRRIASITARASTSSGETFTSRNSRRAFSRSTNSTVRVDVDGDPLGDVGRSERRLHHRAGPSSCARP